MNHAASSGLRGEMASSSPATAAAAAVTVTGSVSATSALDSSAAYPQSMQLLPDERTLFCTHSVASLKQLSEDKRAASDDKKEELRQKVGKNYTQLLLTADNIAHMNQTVKGNKKIFEEIQTKIPTLTLNDPSILTPTTASPLTQLQLQLMLRSYSMAPASIWNYLDDHNFEAAITLYLSMQQVAHRLSEVEHLPIDSQSDHPELKQLIDSALQSSNANTSSVNSPTLAAALSAFFQHHAAYYIELPSLIAHTATQRLQQRSLRTKSYADALAALAMVQRRPAGEMSAYLLDHFLESKHKQIHDLIWSAEQALTTFQSQPHSSSPTPILIHVCQHVLYILQYTLLDVALLFGSIHPSQNPHASLLNKTNQLVQAWTDAHIAERISAIQARATGTHPTSSTPSTFTMSAATLSTRVSVWLKEIQSFLAPALTDRLLPFLSHSRTRSTKSPCASFASLRSAILWTSNWEDSHSLEREEEAEEKKMAPTSSSSSPPNESQSKMRAEEEEETKEQPTKREIKPLTPAEQAKLSRKRMLERWNEACTLLFGRGSVSSGISSPISLFDLFFFEPLRSFSNTLVTRAFERLTLAARVEKYLKPRVITTATQSTNTKKLLLDQEETKDSIEIQPILPPSKSDLPASASDLHGVREDEVQEIVNSFQLQLRRLGRECAAILECDYVQRIGSTKANDAGVQELLFPSLQRYLQEELTPLLTKKYNQLVEKLVEQLKKKLSDLEQSVLVSMSDISTWRSSATLELVEQSVFIGRVCHELMKQKHLISLDTLLDQATTNESQRIQSPTNTSSLTNNPIHLSLSTTAKTAFRVWTRYIAAILSEDFVEEFTKWLQTQKSLEEQGEKYSQLYFKQSCSNRAHNSSTPLGLSLPIYASPAISQLLFQFHHHYYQSFGYHVQSDILGWLLLDVDQALLPVFEKKLLKMIPNSLESGEQILTTLSNSTILQLQFDLQYLFGMLRLPPTAPTSNGIGKGPKGLLESQSDLRTRYLSLLSTIDSHLATTLDQIDWMTSKSTYFMNLQQAFQRGSMLFGVLQKANPFPPVAVPAAATSGGASSFELLQSPSSVSTPLPTNILPLATVATKVLPLPTSLYPSKHPQPVLTPTVSASIMKPLISPPASYTSSSASATTPSTVAASITSGLSFSNLSSNLSSQLSLANTSAAANAKTIGDLGSSLLGKLSATSLWGGGKTTK